MTSYQWMLSHIVNGLSMTSKVSQTSHRFEQMLAPTLSIGHRPSIAMLERCLTRRKLD